MATGKCNVYARRGTCSKGPKQRHKCAEDHGAATIPGAQHKCKHCLEGFVL